MEKRIKFEKILMKYCESCYDYELSHEIDLIFHGIPTKYLKKFPDFIIKPKQNRRRDFYNFCKNYFRYFSEPKLHLSSLERAGLANTSYDAHFAFSLERIKENNKKISYIDALLWDQLAFDDLPEKERRAKEKKLFKKNYEFVPGKVWTEVIVDQLDLKLSEFALVYSKKAHERIEAIKQKLGNNFKIYEGGPLRNIIKQHMKIK